jgi:hypothetical protein
MQPGIYRHYKGQFYRVLFLAKDCDTLEDLVCYEALYANEVSQFWTRSLKDFVANVKHGGKTQIRFRPATAEEIQAICK